MLLKKEDLLECARTILDTERKAKAMYEDCLKKIDDDDIKRTLEIILKDEISHIEIAEELLRVVEWEGDERS